MRERDDTLEEIACYLDDERDMARLVRLHNHRADVLARAAVPRPADYREQTIGRQREGDRGPLHL